MRVLNTCESILELLKTWGNEEKVSLQDLKKAIMWERQAVDERTIQRWIRALETFEYIKRENKTVFTITGHRIVATAHTLSLSK